MPTQPRSVIDLINAKREYQRVFIERPEDITAKADPRIADMNAVDTINTRQAAQVDDTADGGESSSMLVMGYRYLQNSEIGQYLRIAQASQKEVQQDNFFKLALLHPLI